MHVPIAQPVIIRIKWGKAVVKFVVQGNTKAQLVKPAVIPVMAQRVNTKMKKGKLHVKLVQTIQQKLQLATIKPAEQQAVRQNII